LDEKDYMGLALKQAQNAFDNGEFPVGCVIVQDDHVIASGARKGTTQAVPFFSEISHAEIRALQALETIKSGFEPSRSTLYSTMEPCLMCFGAIILSGIRKIVYAYEDPMGGGTSCDLKKLPPLYENCEIEVVSGVLRQKSLDLFNKFFNKENNLYWRNSFLERYTFEQKKENAEE
jgi:tRNA(adenine34) deaminase